ncbi:hypothetical protein, partial [Salmonella sp. s56021]|uniref:hypothetical protein n=1 Tax=Salmonella sp. s56021 TaxID=3159687 RepID=UPI00397EA246
ENNTLKTPKVPTNINGGHVKFWNLGKKKENMGIRKDIGILKNCSHISSYRYCLCKNLIGATAFQLNFLHFLKL